MYNSVPHLDLIKAMIDNGEVEQAEAALDQLETVIKAAQPADEEDDSEDDGLDEEDDSDEDDVQKLGRRSSPPRYPGDPSHAGLFYPEDDLGDAMTEGHENAGEGVRPRVHPNSGHISVDSRNSPTAFDSHVQHVKRRDGVSHTQAMSTARKERPDLFAEHQNSLGSYEQEMGHRRALGKSEHMSGDTTFEQCCEIEMSKGFSPTLAAQRVLANYGNTLPKSNDMMSKAADTVITKFMRLVDQEMRDSNCERHEAMRKVRQSEPELFEAYSLV
jgi:hypothetical protein